MRIEIIETIERLFEIELDWDELYKADPHAHLYLSSDFLCSVAIRVAGKFRILTAWSDDNRCIGLLPLMVTIKWSKTGRWIMRSYRCPAIRRRPTGRFRSMCVTLSPMRNSLSSITPPVSPSA